MWLRLKLTIDTMLSFCASAHARVDPDDWFHWQFGPFVTTSLAVVAGLYTLGLYRLSRRTEPREWSDKLHIASFILGLLFVFAALCSPIETLADSLFSMHMGQHVLLTMMAPPLLVWSRPGPIFAAAFNVSWRRVMTNMWLALGLDHVTSFIMHPITVFTLFCGAFVFWHLPIPYLWA